MLTQHNRKKLLVCHQTTLLRVRGAGLCGLGTRLHSSSSKDGGWPKIKINNNGILNYTNPAVFNGL